MPKFLENKLKQEYGKNSAVPFKVMNSIGAMRGNQETAKGREMEEKHEAKMKTEHSTPMREMRIQLHRAKMPDGKMKLTGATVHHHMMPEKASKTGAFMEETHHSFPFAASDHAGMKKHVMDHLNAALGGGAQAEAEPPEASEEEEA